MEIKWRPIRQRKKNRSPFYKGNNFKVLIYYYFHLVARELQLIGSFRVKGIFNIFLFSFLTEQKVILSVLDVFVSNTVFCPLSVSLSGSLSLHPSLSPYPLPFLPFLLLPCILPPSFPTRPPPPYLSVSPQSWCFITIVTSPHFSSLLLAKF